MITSLRLQNFRSYTNSSFEFEDGVNIIVGPNASGKTNLLEAVLVLARGGSYRVRDSELIQFNKPWARLDGYFEKHTRTLKLQPDKTFVIDDKPYKRLSLERTVPVVLFEPNHLQLVSRGPEQRRDYFDDLLERSLPAFKPLSNNYKRTLAQRNALLKHGRRQADQQLFAWNVRLSQLGSQIALARQNLADEINQTLAKTYSQIAKKRSKLELKYDSQFAVNNYASRLLSKLESNLNTDLDRGFTAHGPHREDFLFYLDGQPAGQTASRGESRSLLLALKIFELDLIEKARDQKPIFLLDDVFSELDGSRRRALVKRLKKHQTIITTTDAESVLEYFSETHNLIPLQKAKS
jgi:DNA replication and repair protein RecF